MAILSTTVEQDVFSIYLNLDACDPSDDQATEDTNPEPLPPLEFSFLPPWHDAPMNLPPLDLEGSRGECWNASPLLEHFSSTSIHDSTLLSPIGPSLECSPSTHWLLTDDEEYVASDDTNSPVIQCRSPSPSPVVSHPISDSRVEFIGAQELEGLAPLSSPAPSSCSSLSTTDSEYSSLFSPGTSALTSPASSILSLDDCRRSCSVSPESASCFSSPSMRLREAMKETGENHMGIITQDSRKSGVKGRRKQRRMNPISSRRRRQVSSGDLQDQDLDQFPYSVAVDGAGNGRPKCECSKSFTRISDLKRHQLESTSCPLAMARRGKKAKADPRFVCDVCGGAFSRYDSLDRHQRNRAACQRVQRLQSRNARLWGDNSDDDE